MFVKKFALSLSCAVVGMVMVIALLAWQGAVLQRELLQREAEHLVEMQRAYVQSEAQTVASDLLYLRDQQLLQAVLAGDAKARSALTREYAAFASNRQVYDQVRCLDRDGFERIRVNYRNGTAHVVPETELQAKGARYYVQRAGSLEDRDVFVSPFDLNVEHGRVEQPIRPVIRFVTPVSDAAGGRLGFVVLNYLGARLLQRVDDLAEQFDGDALLVNSDGGYLLAGEGRAWGWLLDHEHSFVHDHAAAWSAMRGKDSGVILDGEDAFAYARIRLASTDGDESSVVAVARVSSATARARSHDSLWRLVSLGGIAVVLVGISLWFWAKASEVRASQERHIAESEARLRQLSNMLLATQESERRSISRDLHDELGQRVTAVSLDLRSLQRNAAAAPVSERLGEIVADTDGILRGLHTIASRVRPAVLDDLGLHDAVESLVQEFETRHDIAVETKLRIDAPRISKTIGENAYRIVQEALTNVARHAEAQHATVTIETHGHTLRVEVGDSGRGFDPERAAPGRLGLLGMRERAELLEGTFALHTQPGQGTRVVAELPLHEDQSTAREGSAGPA